VTRRYVRSESLGGGYRTDVILDRPKKLNAMSRQSLSQLRRAMESVPEATRVIVLRSSTPRAFCVGADIHEHTNYDSTAALDSSLEGTRAVQSVSGSQIPVVAQIQGHCLGGGLELALACDLRVAAHGSTFSMPEGSLGNTPAWGGIPRLVSLLGPGRAKDLLLTGRTLDSDEALAIGLVERVVTEDELNTQVDALAATISSHPRLAMTGAKLMVNALTEASHHRLLDALGAGFFQTTHAARDAKRQFGRDQADDEIG
jgi:enoyl-CoA hydratase/carnithine racemase